MTEKEKLISLNITVPEEKMDMIAKIIRDHSFQPRTLNLNEVERTIQEKASELIMIDTQAFEAEFGLNKEYYLVRDKELKMFYIVEGPMDFLQYKTEEQILEYESRSRYKMLSTATGQRAKLNLEFLLMNYLANDKLRTAKIILRGVLYENDKYKVYRISKDFTPIEELSKVISKILTEEFTPSEKRRFLNHYTSILGTRERPYLATWELDKSLVYDIYSAIKSNDYVNPDDVSTPFLEAKFLIHKYLKLFILTSNHQSEVMLEVKSFLLSDILTLINEEKLNIDKLIEEIINYDMYRLRLDTTLVSMETLLKQSDALIDFLHEIGFYDKNTYYMAYKCNSDLQYLHNECENKPRIYKTNLFQTITTWFKLIWLTDSWSFKLDDRVVANYSNSAKWMHSIISGTSLSGLDPRYVDSDILSAMMEMFRLRMSKYNNTRTLSTIFYCYNDTSYFWLEYVEHYFSEDIKVIKDKKRRTNVIDCVVNNASYCTKYKYITDINSEDNYSYEWITKVVDLEDILKSTNNEEVKRSIMRRTMKDNLKNDSYEE